MDALEHVENYIRATTTKNPKTAELIKFLTLTQQEKIKSIKTITPLIQLNNLYQILQDALSITVKLKISTNAIMKDCIIHITRREDVPLDIQVRVIKESEPGHASLEGIWGINANSFKFLKNKK